MCDPNPTIADGHFHTTLSLVAKCIGLSDSDGDGFCDADETSLGSDPADANSTPEDPSLVFSLLLTNAGSGGTSAAPGEVGEPLQVCNDGIDNDLDGFIDAADGTQSGSTFTGCLTVDTDGDGWIDGKEALIGTGPNDPCGNDGWPADLDPNNRLDIGDNNSFTAPSGPNDGHGTFNYFGHSVPDVDINGPPDDSRLNAERWDLDPGDGTISIGDMNALNPAVTAPTSYPPMFGGEQAFGKECPWPP